MLGPEGVTNLIVARIEDALPDKLAEMRKRLAEDPDDSSTWLSHHELPDVPEGCVYRSERDQLSMEEWPAVMVLAQGTDPQTGAPARESDGFGELFAYRYRYRLFGWVRGDDYDDTSRKRDRLTLALREILAARPQLTDNDDQDTVRLVHRRGEERYSDTATNNAGRTIAGFYLERFFDTLEWLEAYQPTSPIVGDPQIAIHHIGVLDGFQ